MHICTHMLKYSSKIMTKSDKIIQRRGLMHAWEVWVGGIQWIVKTTCKSFSVCYNVCFKLTFRNEMLWNIFLKKTRFLSETFFSSFERKGSIWRAWSLYSSLLISKRYAFQRTENSWHVMTNSTNKNLPPVNQVKKTYIESIESFT